MGNYILVKDDSVIEQLIKSGFRFIKEENGVSIFENAPKKLDFCKIDKSKIHETNRMNF